MSATSNVKADLHLEEFPGYIAEFIEDLLEKESTYKTRMYARRSLVNMGAEILPYIHLLLHAKSVLVRKEAVKIAELIADKSSIHEFISLLEDHESSIRWIASEGLIRSGRDSIEPLMKALIKCGSSYYVKLGAYHVFKRLFTEEEKDQYLCLMLSLHNFLEINGSARHEASKALRSVARQKEDSGDGPNYPQA